MKKPSKRPGPKVKVPILFMHVRVSTPSGIELSQDLRDDLVRLAQRYASVYGVRVKRRQVSTKHIAALMTSYEKRVALRWEDHP